MSDSEARDEFKNGLADALGLSAAEAEALLGGIAKRLTVSGLGKCDVCEAPLDEQYSCATHGPRRRDTYTEWPEEEGKTP